MIKPKRFFDTSSLLLLLDKAFEEEFVISSITLMELEGIKTNQNKSFDIKYKARKLTRLLAENEGKYSTTIAGDWTYKQVEDFNLPINNDNLIMANAWEYEKTYGSVVFYTDDMACKCIAREIFELEVSGVRNELENKEVYTGYKEAILSDEEMAFFYENLHINSFDCLVNEYLIIKNLNKETKEIRRWTGEEFVRLNDKPIKSTIFGNKIKAKDEYQQMVFDSLLNNTITIISGKAGSGKSLLSLATAMSLIDSGKYDRLVVLYNPTKAKGATESGYYKGTALDKAKQASIGEILCSKLGDEFLLDTIVQKNKLKLLSMAESRGFEVRDNEILFVTEAQNTTRELVKLCLTRASEGCKIILEGDYNTQVDSYAFEGENNGMKRAIDVLKGEDLFGCVELKNVWRSRIATLADKI